MELPSDRLIHWPTHPRIVYNWHLVSILCVQESLNWRGQESEPEILCMQIMFSAPELWSPFLLEHGECSSDVREEEMTDPIA